MKLGRPYDTPDGKAPKWHLVLWIVLMLTLFSVPFWMVS